MKQNVRFCEFLTVAVIGLLCYYTYRYMLSLGFEETLGSTIAIISLSVVGISLVTIFLSNTTISSRFYKLWWFWIIWLLFDFFVLELRGEGVANIVFVTFAPMTFLFFFTVRQHSDRIPQIATLGFIVLFVIAFFINISFLNYIQIDYGEEIGITNLVYWCLCAVPFIFLIKRRWIFFTFLVATTVIILMTGKRSANICLLLMLVSILLNIRRQGGKIKNLIFIFVGGIALFFIVNHYFSFAVEGVMDRMRSIEDSQGSGRIPLYHDVFRVIETNSFFDWLVGRGYGSITITEHTNAHNDALQMLFEYGLVGLVFYLLMLWNAIRSTRILYKHNSPFFMGYLVSLIIFVVLGMVSNLVVFNSYFAFICAYWGLAEDEISQHKYLKK